MRYFGGKAKIAKELSKELQSRLKEGQAFVDLFCGSCNVVSKIKAPVRIANDLHKELIALHKAVQGDNTVGAVLQEGWIPPSSVSELEYKEIKNSNEVPDYLKAFVGFGCSFSGKYWGGYARGSEVRNYATNAKNTLLTKHKTLKDVQFTNLQYHELLLHDNSLIYCDIPYKETTGYSTGSFQHESFYLWAKEMKDKGHTVLVSEYLQNLPEGWTVEWKYQSKKDIRNKEGVQESTVEILMSPV